MKSSGITVVEVLIVVAVLALVLFGALANLSGVNGDQAMKEAERWASEMQIKPIGITCSSVDSDGDGYVSCMVRHEGGIENIECRGMTSVGHGCRAPKMRAVGSGR